MPRWQTPIIFQMRKAFSKECLMQEITKKLGALLYINRSTWESKFIDLDDLCFFFFLQQVGPSKTWRKCLTGYPSNQKQLGMCLPSGWEESQKILVGQVAKSASMNSVIMSTDGTVPTYTGPLIFSLKRHLKTVYWSLYSSDFPSLYRFSSLL